MKALMIVALVLAAGCAPQHQSQSIRVNDTRWSEYNNGLRGACVLRIIEIAPPTATKEELDYNFERCLLKNKVFI